MGLKKQISKEVLVLVTVVIEIKEKEKEANVAEKFAEKFYYRR